MNDIRKFNYSAFNVPSDFFSYVVKPKAIFSSLFIVLLVVIMSAWSPFVLPVIFLFGSIGFLLCVIILSRKLEQKRFRIFAQFAHDNNLPYTPRLSPDDKSGTLFSHGHSRVIANDIQIEISGFSSRFYEYMYVTGSGKNRLNYRITVAEVELPQALPHFVIDSIIEEGENYQSTLPIVFDSSQKIELEGDFYKYFSVYAPTKHEVDALVILAPNIMEVMMQHAAKCDIEIIGNKLFVYWPNNDLKPAEVAEKLLSLQDILNHIGGKLRKGDFSPHSQTNKIIASDAATSHPARLAEGKKFGFLSGLLLIFYIAFALSQWFIHSNSFLSTFGEMTIVFVSLAMPVLVYSYLIYKIVQKRSNQQKLKELQQRFPR